MLTERFMKRHIPTSTPFVPVPITIDRIGMSIAFSS